MTRGSSVVRVSLQHDAFCLVHLPQKLQTYKRMRFAHFCGHTVENHAMIAHSNFADAARTLLSQTIQMFFFISLSHSAFARNLQLLFATRFPITILKHTIFARCARLLVFCFLRWYFNTIFSRAVFLRYFHARITRTIFMRNFHAQSSRAIFTRNFHAQFSRIILKVIFTRYCQTLFSRAIFPQYCHTRLSRIIFTRYFHKLVIR